MQLGSTMQLVKGQCSLHIMAVCRDQLSVHMGNSGACRPHLHLGTGVLCCQLAHILQLLHDVAVLIHLHVKACNSQLQRSINPCAL